MLNKLKPKSEFSRNVLTLMTGTTIAQAIPIAISPILTRIYTPEDFGVFALFIAIISIFGSIANGRYELAIMLPKKDEDAINIMALGFIINVILSFFLLFIVLIFHDTILNLLNNKEISPWLYLVPISVFLIGCFNLLNYFNNRKKLYKDLAKANVFKSIATAVVQLSLGFLKAGAFGLISGQFFSQIVSNTKLFFNIKRLNLFSKINKKQIVTVGKRYKKFPLIDTFVALIYIVYNRAIIVFLQKFYNSSAVGQYFFAERLVQVPLSFIRTSISNVFFEKISKLTKEDIYSEANQLSIKLFKLSFIPFFLIIFLSPYYIPFIFGREWSILYKYMIIISISAYISFLMSPYSYVLKIIEKQEVSFLLHLIKLLFLLFYFILFNELLIMKFLFFFILVDSFISLFFLNIQIYFLIHKFRITFIHIIWILLSSFIYWYIFI